MDPAELFPEGVSLRLGANGRGRISMGSEDGAIGWSLNGNEFILETDGESSVGRLEEGVITIELLNSGVIMTLEKVSGDEVSEYHQTEETPLQKQWGGGWYGWWKLSSASGDWTAMNDCWYDCCAYIAVDAEGGAQLTLWDEDTGRDDPMAVVSLRVDGERAVSEGGFFWNDELSPAEWVIDPALSSYADMLCVEAEYEAGDGAFRYEIYLRPWGLVWDDIEAENADMLPYYYYDWYMPLIEDGKPMPDRICPDKAE